MAYTTYTPTATKLATVDLPDDAELETSGIGAVNTPAEDLADGILWATDAVAVVYDNPTLLDVASTVFAVNSAVSVAYQDVTAANGALDDVAITVPAVTIGGAYRLVVTISFSVNADTATGAYYDVFSSATGAEVPNTETMLTPGVAAINIPITLSFVAAATAAAATYTLRGRAATGSWNVVGPVRMHATRVRIS